MEWMLSRMENETRTRSRSKDEKSAFHERYRSVHCSHEEFRSEEERFFSDSSKNPSISFIQTGVGRATEISVHLNKFTAPMADECKTFAYLDRGSPFKDVFEVSGYSQENLVALMDVLIEKSVRIRVLMFSRAVGYELEICPTKDQGIPGSFNACHVAKQVMAYFLWKHTALYEEVPGDSGEEAEERNVKLRALQESKPAALQMKTDIYVSRKPCLDCKAFQKRVSGVTTIGFNIIFLSPKHENQGEEKADFEPAE